LHKGTKLIGDHSSAWMPGGVSFRQPLLQAKSGFADGAIIQIYGNSITGDPAPPNGGSIRGLCLYGAGFAPARDQVRNLVRLDHRQRRGHRLHAIWLPQSGQRRQRAAAGAELLSLSCVGQYARRVVLQRPKL
jgi:hypothetical protein